jgi:hypothetical protein
MDEKDKDLTQVPAKIEDVEIAPLSDDDLESVAGGEAAECTCFFTFCRNTGCTFGDDDGEEGAPVDN